MAIDFRKMRGDSTDRGISTWVGRTASPSITFFLHGFHGDIRDGFTRSIYSSRLWLQARTEMVVDVVRDSVVHSELR